MKLKDAGHSCVRNDFWLVRSMRYLILVLVLLLAAPLVARLGPWKILRTWKSPAGSLGEQRPLTFSMEEGWAYVDVFRLYRSHRLMITDGGYTYLLDLTIPNRDPAEYLQRCEVAWDEEKVTLMMPDGEQMVFPAKAVLGRVGNQARHSGQ